MPPVTANMAPETPLSVRHPILTRTARPTDQRLITGDGPQQPRASQALTGGAHRFRDATFPTPDGLPTGSGADAAAYPSHRS